MALDLSSSIPADTSTLEILKPGGVEGTGWFIEFAGPAHPKTIAWTNDSARKGLRKQQQIEQQQFNGKKVKVEDRDIDDVRKENVSWVVSRIVGWDPAPDFGDGAVVFSEKAALDLLVKPEVGWAFAQMVEFLSNETSFIRRSAAS